MLILELPDPFRISIATTSLKTLPQFWTATTAKWSMRIFAQAGRHPIFPLSALKLRFERFANRSMTSQLVNCRSEHWWADYFWWQGNSTSSFSLNWCCFKKLTWALKAWPECWVRNSIFPTLFDPFWKTG